MKASTTRYLVWSGTALVAGFCVWQFVDFVFLGGRVRRTSYPNPEEIRKKLRKVDKPGEKIRQGPEFYNSFVDVNLTGVRPKPPEVAQSRPESEGPEVKINPLDTVLGLKGTRLDANDPSKSAAIVFWKDTQVAPADARKYSALVTGQWFPKPYEKTYRLKRVEERRAIFEMAEGDSFTELAPLVLGELKGVAPVTRRNGTASGPFVMPTSRPGAGAPPKETTQVAPNEYVLSEKDRDEAKDKGLDMIGRDVHTAPYLDPKTKRPEGLLVKSVRQDSLPSKLGIRENDVVKAVNGVPVRSTADVYAFAKDHPEAKEISVAVERFGRVVKLTYRLP